MGSEVKQEESTLVVRRASETKRRGLFTTKDIPRGGLVYSEEVMVVRETLESFGGSLKEYDMALAQELKAVKEPNFIYEFFRLPSLSKAEWGPLGAFFESGNIPQHVFGETIRVLGLKSAYLNHACIPNAQSTLMKGLSQAGEQMNLVMVYACTHIAAGEEITVAYSHLHMDVASRKQFTQAEYGFKCECQHCEYPSDDIERRLGFINLKYPVILLPTVIHLEPAGALQLAHDIAVAYLNCGVLDVRLGEIFEHCARICGWHSDAGRAMDFLSKAQAVYLKAQGPHGPDYIRLFQLQNDPTCLPNYGKTQRGFSAPSDVKIIWSDPYGEQEILYMLGKDVDEYMKLQDVKPRETTRETESCPDKEAEDIQMPEESLQELIKKLELEKIQYDEDRLHRRDSNKSAEKKMKMNRGKKGKGKGK